MAASVTAIDGVPVMPVETLTRAVLRERLVKLGTDGMNAIAAALESVQVPGAADVRMAAAKN